MLARVDSPQRPRTASRSCRALLCPVLLLLAAGCSAGGRTTTYGRTPTTAAGDASKWRPAPGRQHISVRPAAASLDRYNELTAGRGRGMAGLLFELQAVPAGARLDRAVLRLRRKSAVGKPELEVMNVNKGLRIIRFATGEPLFGILRARVTRNKREMLSSAFDDQTDEQTSGLALTAYPVECSLPSESYRAGLFSSGKMYGQLLEQWNPLRSAGHGLAGAWDQLDVTGPARAQLAKDRKLLVGLKVSAGSLVWFGGGRKRPWAGPHLIVEYTPGAAPRKPKPAPQPRPEPKPQPVPKPRSAPKPGPRRGPARRTTLSDSGGGIVIGSKPDRADIYVDGKYVGTTPSRELRFPPGEIRLRIEKQGFRPWKRRVTILKNNVISVAPQLEPEPESALQPRPEPDANPAPAPEAETGPDAGAP
jgi:hypothetical protein